jgi:hypothetical protein
MSDSQATRHEQHSLLPLYRIPPAPPAAAAEHHQPDNDDYDGGDDGSGSDPATTQHLVTIAPNISNALGSSSTTALPRSSTPPHLMALQQTPLFASLTSSLGHALGIRLNTLVDNNSASAPATTTATTTSTNTNTNLNININSNTRSVSALPLADAGANQRSDTDSDQDFGDDEAPVEIDDDEHDGAGADDDDDEQNSAFAMVDGNGDVLVTGRLGGRREIDRIREERLRTTATQLADDVLNEHSAAHEYVANLGSLGSWIAWLEATIPYLLMLLVLFVHQHSYGMACHTIACWFRTVLCGIDRSRYVCLSLSLSLSRSLCNAMS